MSIIAKQVIFRGQVQGVGFRCTVRDIVRDLPITGYVRNQRDGSVEAVFQGTEEDIQACLKRIRNFFSSHIRKIESDDLPVNPDWVDFEITY